MVGGLVVGRLYGGGGGGESHFWSDGVTYIFEIIFLFSSRRWFWTYYLHYSLIIHVQRSFGTRYIVETRRQIMVVFYNHEKYFKGSLETKFFPDYKISFLKIKKFKLFRLYKCLFWKKKLKTILNYKIFSRKELLL